MQAIGLILVESKGVHYLIIMLSDCIFVGFLEDLLEAEVLNKQHLRYCITHTHTHKSTRQKQCAQNNKIT